MERFDVAGTPAICEEPCLFCIARMTCARGKGSIRERKTATERSKLGSLGRFGPGGAWSFD